MTRSITPRARHRGRTVLAALAVASATMIGSSAAAADSPERGVAAPPDDCELEARRMSIATGNSTGVYYVLGGGIASLISENTEAQATAAETGASVQNIQTVSAGDYDIGFSLADTAADGVAGTASFEEPQPIYALGRIYANFTHVVVRSDSGIESIEDMAGKRISTGSPLSGTEVIAGRLLSVAGLDIDSDVEAQRLDLSQTIDGMKDGAVDGMFWSGGLPTAAITDLTTTMGDDVTFLDVTPYLEGMQEINAVYDEDAIPADAYGLDADVPTIVTPNVLFVRDDMSDAEACALTYLIWSNVETLSTVHPAASELDPSLAMRLGPIPLHPGSQRALEALGGTPPDDASAGSET